MALTNFEEELFKALVEQLPKEKFWNIDYLYQWRGFWFPGNVLKASLAFQSKFEPRDDDIILTSSIKTGTTWLMALCLSILHRSNHSINSNIDEGDDTKEEEDDVLTKGNPHTLVPTVESMVYGEDPYPFLATMPSPRLLHSHLPYSLLPDSMRNSKCKIIYIARNSKDAFVSMWHFFNTIISGRYNQEPMSLESAFESFCRGTSMYGPYLDHVLEYWKESLKMPQKILFLKYEDLKRDPKAHVKMLTDFLGRPSDKEEDIEEVLRRCSLERLKNLEVNKDGKVPWNNAPSNSFFRRGVVGDSMNYFTPEMNDRLNHLSQEKLEAYGLNLDMDAEVEF